jgi:chaperonin GroES
MRMITVVSFSVLRVLMSLPTSLRRSPLPSLAEIIEPRPGKIAVLIDPKEEVASGLFIPADLAPSLHNPRPTQGTIVSLGPEDDSEEGMMEDDIGDLKVGDRVIFGKYSGVEIKLKSRPGRPPERIVILTAKDILARVKVVDETTSDDIVVRT